MIVRDRFWRCSLLSCLLAVVAVICTSTVALAACPPALGQGSGALSRQLNGGSGATNGGIDFSSLQLRYVSDTATGGRRGISYAFKAEPGAGIGDPSAGQQAVQEASDAFFVWLELQPSTFTVNLNPTEPDRIVDADLGRTDVGHIMLEADFQMKKTVARLIHPDTPGGAQFWQQLQAGPDGSTCLSMRQWIVPGPATVREDGNQLYILDAPLVVMLESDYLNSSSFPQYSCPGQDQAIQKHNESVFRSMILPQVQKAVNQAPEYADLRRVYLSRVAAEWYRTRSLTQPTAYGDLIDRGDVSLWVSRQSWSPKEVFDQYVASYKNGEFNVTHQTQNGDVVETRTYVYGGVDFSRIPFARVSATDFSSKWHGPTGIARSFDKPLADPDGKSVWLGGTNVVTQPAPRPPIPLPTPATLLVAALLTLTVCLAGLGLWGVGRWRAAGGPRIMLLPLLCLLAMGSATQFGPWSGSHVVLAENLSVTSSLAAPSLPNFDRPLLWILDRKPNVRPQDGDGMSMWQTRSSDEVSRFMAARVEGDGRKPDDVYAFYDESAVTDAGIQLRPTPGRGTALVGTGLVHFSARPPGADPDPAVDLTVKQQAELQARFNGLAPPTRVKPKQVLRACD
jgi:hypothetical protein